MEELVETYNQNNYNMAPETISSNSANEPESAYSFNDMVNMYSNDSANESSAATADNTSNTEKSVRLINDSGDILYVSKNDVESYLNDGWKVWSLGKVNKGTVWVNNGKVQHRVSKDKAQEYIDKGYSYGRIGRPLAGRKRMTDGVHNITVTDDKVSYYEGLGYRRGITRGAKKGDN